MQYKEVFVWLWLFILVNKHPDLFERLGANGFFERLWAEPQVCTYLSHTHNSALVGWHTRSEIHTHHTPPLRPVATLRTHTLARGHSPHPHIHHHNTLRRIPQRATSSVHDPCQQSQRADVASCTNERIPMAKPPCLRAKQRLTLRREP